MRKAVFLALRRLQLIEPLLNAMRAARLYEPKITRLMRTMYGHIFADIGSNAGYYTRLMRRNFELVFPFDPNPRYTAIPFALSDYNGTTWLYLNSDAGSGDTLKKNFKFLGDSYTTDKKILVEVRRFDAFFKEHVSLAKIDVEGSEFEVLRGMERNLPDTIVLELHDLTRRYELHRWFFTHSYAWRKIGKYWYVAAKGKFI